QDENRAIPAHGSRHRQADPRIASRGLDDGAARSEQAAALSVDDHGQRYSILDATTRIYRLELNIDSRGQARRNSLQLNEWRSADDLENIAEHGAPPCVSQIRLVSSQH